MQEGVKKIESKAYVNLHGQWLCLDDVNVINTSEDIFGEDVVEYSHEGEVYTARPVYRVTKEPL